MKNEDGKQMDQHAAHCMSRRPVARGEPYLRACDCGLVEAQKVRELVARLEKLQAYDWNADPFYLTLIEGALSKVKALPREKE